MTSSEALISRLSPQIENLGLSDALNLMTKVFPPAKVVFSTSFGKEDQVIIDAIARGGLDFRIFTLDTGRLFSETYSLWASTLEKYKVHIRTFVPEEKQLSDFLAEKGPNSFYASVENRKLCCGIRKVVPLGKALRGFNVWITGIRSEQSNNRSQMPILEWDGQNEIIKFHPLVRWTQADVDDYIAKHSVPYNPLHDKGFVSIGCAPCTRAIRAGEDFRAGRWWWEDSNKKECGLHTHEKDKP